MDVLNWPQRLALARLPTPVEILPSLSAELGVSLLVKRDDLTGAALSGNKIRKLEFSLAEARARDATAVLTTGGLQSNHARATAIAARQLGMQPYLLLRSPDGQAPAGAADGNLLLDRLVGAQVRFITPEQYQQRDALLADWAQELATAGERPFVIPEGASDGRGALGYAAMIDELRGQREAGAWPEAAWPDAIVHACGSGGTAAGIALGVAQHALPTRVVAYAVCDDEAYFRALIDGIIADAQALVPGLGAAGEVRYEVVDDYKGIGYALSTPEELAFIHERACADALLLDPVYTGKAFGGLLSDLRAGRRYAQGETILFVHTGGLFGVFPKRAEFEF